MGSEMCIRDRDEHGDGDEDGVENGIGQLGGGEDDEDDAELRGEEALMLFRN